VDTRLPLHHKGSVDRPLCFSNLAKPATQFEIMQTLSTVAKLSLFSLAVGLVVGGFAKGATPDLEAIRKDIESYKVLPAFVAPGPAFDAKAVMKDKSIVSIPVSSSIPFITTLEQAFGNVSKEVGFKFMEWNNQGRIPDWIDGMNYAISQKVTLVDLLAGADPRILKTQIETATQAGVKVVSSHYSGMKQATSPYLTSNVPSDYETGARLLAEWAILKTNGKPNVLVIASDEVYSTAAMVDAMKAEFAQCPDAKVVFVNVPITDWASKIQPTVVSAIQGNPDLNFIIPVYDSMCQFVVPAITLTGAKDRVKITSFNGTPFVIGYVQQGKVDMDVGESLDWSARGIMDAEMRLVGGLEPVKDPHTPVHIFDATNADSVGHPPKANTGYGTEYVNEFHKLWGLSK
jgi:ribose transport system substrate-binding protein